MSRQKRKYFIINEAGKKVFVYAERKLEAIGLYEEKGYQVTAHHIRLVNNPRKKTPT